MVSSINECRQDDIVTLSLDRLDVRNAISMGLLDELLALRLKIEQDSSIRAVIITGAGDRAFSAGADLKERQAMSQDQVGVFVQKIQRTFQEIAELSVPTIAAINGDAFGGGLELALACDLRVLNKSARLGLTECSLGIIPGAGGTQRLPRLIGLSKAFELILLAERIDAERALAIGLVNFLSDDAEKTKEQALSIAQALANNAPLAVKAAKKAMRLGMEQELSSALGTELLAYNTILTSSDRLEGLKAFHEKRQPRFQGR